MATMTDSLRAGGKVRGSLQVTARAATNIPIDITTHASQSVSAFRIRNSAGTNLLSLDNDGNLTVLGTTTTADTTVTDDFTVTDTLTVNGTATFNGSAVIGDAAADTLTVNAVSTFSSLATFNGNLAANNGNIQNLTANVLNVTGSTSLGTTTFSSTITPSVTDGAALGTSSLMWSDLFLASGAVINFDASDVTLTHGSNVLTLGGGNLALGANSLTMTGSIAATGARVTKGWFTDLECTNAMVGSITGNAATVTSFSPAGGSLTLAGADALTLTTSAATDVTLPTTGTLATLAGAEALSAKTLTAAKVATGDGFFDGGGDEYMLFTEAATPITYIGIVSGNTTVAPAIRGQGETNTGLLLAGTGTGKVRVGDGADTSKLLTFELVGATTAKTMTITSSHTDNRTLTLPDATDTLVGLATTDTLTNKTIGAGTLVLAETAGIGLDPAGSADEKWSGITVTGTAGATLAVGDLVYLDVTAGEWLLADADAAATAGDVPLALCILAASDGGATNLLLQGTMRSAAFPGSIALGAPVYVDVTAGDISATKPSGTDDVVRRVGFAITVEPNTIFFNPSNDYITIV